MNVAYLVIVLPILFLIAFGGDNVGVETRAEKKGRRKLRRRV